MKCNECNIVLKKFYERHMNRNKQYYYREKGFFCPNCHGAVTNEQIKEIGSIKVSRFLKRYSRLIIKDNVSSN